VILKYSKLQNKSKIKKFWKRINQELKCTPRFYLHTPSKVDHQKPCSAPPVFTKLHPFYHLNSTQPDHVMWQSSPFKISQPEQATCNNPSTCPMEGCHVIIFISQNRNPNFSQTLAATINLHGSRRRF